ncbi:MAG: tryptophan synthase subunit alpha [Gemmatimonadota bacterium]|nr:tryptophan synthase subunit alpha [Gemmatimonadota bacterium]
MWRGWGAGGAAQGQGRDEPGAGVGRAGAGLVGSPSMTGGAPQGRIAARFARLAAEGRTGFIPYVTAGYPTLEHTRALVAGLGEAGADVIELGIPFSDPMADGPTIQRSSQRALDQGTTVDDVFAILAELRESSEVPVVIFSYLNPVHSRGAETFVRQAAEAGADGILPLDLPLGADPALEASLEACPLDLVRLVAPTTDAARVGEIARASQGFVYYIARTGVTGARRGLRGELAREAGAVRAVSPCPVAVGFGVSTPEHARAVGAAADAVVVGSALVDRLDEGGVSGALELARELRAALDGVRPG